MPIFIGVPACSSPCFLGSFEGGAKLPQFVPGAAASAGRRSDAHGTRMCLLPGEPYLQPLGHRRLHAPAGADLDAQAGAAAAAVLLRIQRAGGPCTR